MRWQVIDSQGYRANIGIILANAQHQLFWARRINEQAWQFPQGGLQTNESYEQGMFRELHEETGLLPEHVSILGQTKDWLHYKLPESLIRRQRQPVCIGQKQIWFALRLQVDESHICLNVTDRPEFDAWQWVDYWQPVNDVIAFKQSVYHAALTELAEVIMTQAQQA